MAGRTRRIALREYVYRPRKSRIELAAYSAHLTLPVYFGSYEWSIPVRAIAVVDLTVPGSPRATRDIARELLGRTVTHLFTTARARTATTLLLFAEPQRVPPLRIGPSLDPNVRPFLPFGFFSSRRPGGASVDGLLLRVDDPRGAVDRLVAAGALRGIYRGGTWRVDHGESGLRPPTDPPWARRSVDRLDGAARMLLVGGLAAAWNLPNIPRLYGHDVAFWAWSQFADDDIPLVAWAVVAAMLGAALASRLLASLLYRRAPTAVSGVAPARTARARRQR
jgi:hypothetical protein